MAALGESRSPDPAELPWRGAASALRARGDQLLVLVVLIAIWQALSWRSAPTGSARPGAW